MHGRVVDKVSVEPEAFSPRPKVRSTVLKIELLPEPRLTERECLVLRDLLRAAFGQRRKTLGNTMKSWLRQSREDIDGYLRARDIDPKRRGETLSIDEFVNLSRALNDSGLLPPKVDR